MKKLFLTLILLFIANLSQAKDIVFDGVITAYSDPVALNAQVLYSAIYKGTYIDGQGYKVAVKIIKDWDKNIKPWANNYFYFYSERTGPIPIYY